MRTAQPAAAPAPSTSTTQYKGQQPQVAQYDLQNGRQAGQQGQSKGQGNRHNNARHRKALFPAHIEKCLRLNCQDVITDLH